ncbi:DNA-directed DNA polymerase [Tanacetum coccineum]
MLKRAAWRLQQNESLAIAERNLFDAEASSSNNTGAKPQTPPKTLHEHSHPNPSSFQNPITLPTEQSGRIVDSSDIWLIQKTCTFQGLRNEDPLHHVKHYLSIVDNIQDDGATWDTSRLCFFHFSLKGKAAEWLDRIPPTQILTWDQLVSRFLDYFFPIGRSHEVDECKQTNMAEQVCLSGGDIYDDPSLLSTVRNCTETPESEAPTFAITTRSGVITQDPPFPALPRPTSDNLTEEKLEKAASSVKLSEECSAIIQRSLPQKEGDPGSFTLPCLIVSLAVKNVLADLGASINLMPYSLFRRLGISKFKPTKMSIQLAGRSIKYPIGVYENLLVKISKFIFLVDFVVLEMDEDELVPIILGRPFLTTAKAIIDVHGGKLSLRVRSETVTFKIRKSMKSKHSHDDYLYYADHTAKLVQEQWVDTINHDKKWTEEEEEDSNEVLATSFYPRTESVEPTRMESPRESIKTVKCGTTQT